MLLQFQCLPGCPPKDLINRAKMEKISVCSYTQNIEKSVMKKRKVLKAKILVHGDFKKPSDKFLPDPLEGI